MFRPNEQDLDAIRPRKCTSTNVGREGKIEPLPQMGHHSQWQQGEDYLEFDWVQCRRHMNHMCKATVKTKDRPLKPNSAKVMEAIRTMPSRDAPYPARPIFTKSK